jgi:quercetin dioxygenase-like cupin family protein
MPFIDTKKLELINKGVGWRGRLFHSANMTFGHWEFDEGATVHEHSHPQEEVWQVTEGELEITVDGIARVVEPGVAAVVPPNVLHSVRAKRPGRAIVVDCPLREFE